MEQDSIWCFLLAVLAWLLQWRPEKICPLATALCKLIINQYKEREWEMWGKAFMVSWLNIILTWHKIQFIQTDYGLNCLCSSLTSDLYTSASPKKILLTADHVCLPGTIQSCLANGLWIRSQHMIYLLPLTTDLFIFSKCLLCSRN